jgi:hypothetical protein
MSEASGCSRLAHHQVKRTDERACEGTCTPQMCPNATNGKVPPIPAHSRVKAADDTGRSGTPPVSPRGQLTGHRPDASGCSRLAAASCSSGCSRPRIASPDGSCKFKREADRGELVTLQLTWHLKTQGILLVGCPTLLVLRLFLNLAAPMLCRC